jgi:hypothetical protein
LGYHSGGRFRLNPPVPAHVKLVIRNGNEAVRFQLAKASTKTAANK